MIFQSVLGVSKITKLEYKSGENPVRYILSFEMNTKQRACIFSIEYIGI